MLIHAAYPCSSRSRSKIRFEVCRCFLGRPSSSARIPLMIPANGSSFGRAGGRLRRYPGGTENASILAMSAGRFQTAAPLPVGSDPRSVPRTEPVHIAPLPSSPALGRYAKGLPAAVILLRRNRTDRPLNEGFLLRRLQRRRVSLKRVPPTGQDHQDLPGQRLSRLPTRGIC